MATPNGPGNGPGNGPEFRRGRESGRQDAQLEEHAVTLATLQGAINELSAIVKALATGVEDLRQDARLRDERVSVAADTLATETERRRSDLADTAAGKIQATAEVDRRFTRRERMMASGMGLAGLIITAIAIFTR